MEADFSGYATKAGLKCSDGRTIMPDAFKHQDTAKVPLVWQHGHNDPENVLGHAILENRDDGVYAYGFFNKSSKSEHARGLVEHGDINMLSIWANDLIERAGRVLHGAIREVSLVLSGANPGALIENVTIRHSNGDDDTLEDEAIIYTGLTLEHGVGDAPAATPAAPAAPATPAAPAGPAPAVGDPNATVQDVYNSMTPQQQQVLHYMLGEALSAGTNSTAPPATPALSQSGPVDGVMATTMDQITTTVDNMAKQINSGGVDSTMPQTMSDLATMMQHLSEMMTNNVTSQGDSDAGADGSDPDGPPSGSSNGGTLANSNVSPNNDPKGKTMKHNVFESVGKDDKKPVLSHADVKGIFADAVKTGSLKTAVEDYALAHGITDIDTLFPEVVATDSSPQFLQRRIEWVAVLLAAVSKSPFSRIKTISADITVDEARAKGYIKGTLKKEEFFNVVRRVTTPTTIYKKQALDRDDITDITDFDVVAWLQTEMRLMLDEELARAILIGDGRDISSEDKINEQNIRPIAKDHELFAVNVNVNINAVGSNPAFQISDAIVANRRYYKGTGLPTFFTTESIISYFLLQRDTLGRKIYQSIDDVTAELRVSSIVPVEAMEEDETLMGIIVNPVDYVVGATAGGQVSLFDMFDIDYNKQKYLIETRCSGTLNKLKSAIVIRSVDGTDVVVIPTDPGFDPVTGILTIVDKTGVVYTNADTEAVMNAAGSPYTIAPGAQINVVATPASGYYFTTDVDAQWTFATNLADPASV